MNIGDKVIYNEKIYIIKEIDLENGVYHLINDNEGVCVVISYFNLN